jgi:hypothetical protein
VIDPVTEQLRCEPPTEIVFPGQPSDFLSPPQADLAPDKKGKFSVTLQFDSRFLDLSKITLRPSDLKKLKAAAKKKKQKFNPRKIRFVAEALFVVKKVAGTADIGVRGKSPILRERTRRNRVTIRGLSAGTYSATYQVQITANGIVLGSTQPSQERRFTAR